jgi:hypothetical protein
MNSRNPFTPLKSAPEIIPETPASEIETESCARRLTEADLIIGESTSCIKDTDTDCLPKKSSSRRRARVLESSDEEAENLRTCRPPKFSRKQKKAISSGSSDDDVKVVEVEMSTETSIGGERPTVDLTTCPSPHNVAMSGLETEGAKDRDLDKDFEDSTEDSVKELLSKCEEVSEGLRKQVELAVIEQPKCVGCEKLRLKKYQLVGLSWLNNLHMQGVNGILAGTSPSSICHMRKLNLPSQTRWALERQFNPSLSSGIFRVQESPGLTS